VTRVSTDSLVGHPLTARLSRGGVRLRQFDADHPWVADAALVAVLVLMFGVPQFAPHDNGPSDLISLFTTPPVAVVVLLQAGLLVPLFWRRRTPALAFHLVAAVFILQWAIGAVLRTDIALLVALYSLVLHGDLRRLPWSGFALATALGVVAWRLSPAVSLTDTLLALVIAATAAAALGFAVRIRRAQVAALRDRAVQLEIERDQRTQLAAATERTRVAREMHDIVGHSLSVIITLADGGAYAADLAPERGKEALHLIGDTGRRALAELRRALGLLREQADAVDLSPQPAVADLDSLCDSIRAAGPEIVYQTTGDLSTLDLGVQLSAYRIVQEALTNALKHAGPLTKLHLELTADGPQLRILVRDTGGPGTPGETGGTGHGLIGMRERAALYGGTVVAGPEPGGGWAVRAVLLPAFEGAAP